MNIFTLISIIISFSASNSDHVYNESWYTNGSDVDDNIESG
jgi:hypothetical protein